jgi:hypothetical protein
VRQLQRNLINPSTNVLRHDIVEAAARQRPNRTGGYFVETTYAGRRLWSFCFHQFAVIIKTKKVIPGTDESSSPIGVANVLCSFVGKNYKKNQQDHEYSYCEEHSHRSNLLFNAANCAGVR